MADNNGSLLKSIEVFPVRDGRGFGFSAKELNQIARAEYLDTFGFYQNRFNVFGFMQINQLRKFVIWSPKGHPLMWQPYNSCTMTPTGSLTMGKRELEPDAMAIFEKFCHDELFNSCFEHFLDFRENGSVGMTAEGERMFGELVRELLANAALGARILLTAGQFYDPDTVEYNNENTANLTSLFRRTHETVQGWLKVAYDAAAAGATHLNHPGMISAGDFDDTGYTGDILDLYDDLRTNARKPLQQLINQGGIQRGGRFAFRPLFVVSDSFFNAVVAEYNALASQAATNRVRISVREISGNGLIPQMVYYIDQTPIIPLSDITGFDPYIASQTHFAGIVASGNIQMGLSFDSIPENINDGIAMLMGKVTDGGQDNYGTFWFRSHALALAAIADTDYMSSVILSTEDSES